MLAVSVITGPVSAQNDQPYSLKGVELGMTLEQFQAVPVPPEVGEDSEDDSRKRFKLPPLNRVYRQACSPRGAVLVCQWVKANDPRAYAGQMRTPFASGSGYIDFHFIETGGEKRLAKMDVQSNMVQFHDLLSSYRAKYGEAEESSSSVQNSLGASFVQETFKWSRGENVIEMRTMCGRIDYLCLTYTNRPLQALADQAKQRALSEGSDDF